MTRNETWEEAVMQTKKYIYFVYEFTEDLKWFHRQAKNEQTNVLIVIVEPEFQMATRCCVQTLDSNKT